MENFQEFIKSFRPQQFALGLPINLLINTLVMRFVVKRLSDATDKVSLVRCAICAILLYLVSSLAVALFLYPTTLAMLLAVIIWLVASMAVIRVVFQLTYQSGGGILFLYLLVLVLIHLLIKIFMR